MINNIILIPLILLSITYNYFRTFMAILETSGDFYNLLAGIGSCAAVVVTLIIFIISSIFSSRRENKNNLMHKFNDIYYKTFNLRDEISRQFLLPFTKTTTQYLKQYEERQEEITKLIVVEQSKETVTITEKEIRKYYQDALRLEPQMLVNYLIKEITLFDNRADIYYNSPIKSTDSPDNSQGFSFYSKSIRLGHKLMIVTLFIR